MQKTIDSFFAKLYNLIRTWLHDEAERGGDTLRDQLVAARKAFGWSQKYVADKAGISRSHYANIELGLRNPDYGTAKKIASIVKRGARTVFYDLDGFRMKATLPEHKPKAG